MYGYPIQEISHDFRADYCDSHTFYEIRSKALR